MRSAAALYEYEGQLRTINEISETFKIRGKEWIRLALKAGDKTKADFDKRIAVSMRKMQNNGIAAARRKAFNGYTIPKK